MRALKLNSFKQSGLFMNLVRLTKVFCFIAAAYFMDVSYAQAQSNMPFPEGTKIAILTDLGLWATVCEDCQDMRYSSIRFMLAAFYSKKEAPDERSIYTVEYQDGKIRLKHEGGKYLSVCTCRKDNTPIIAATLGLESNGKVRTEGLFVFEKKGDKYTIKGNNGRYLSRFQPGKGMKNGKRFILAAYRTAADIPSAEFEVIEVVKGMKVKDKMEEGNHKTVIYEPYIPNYASFHERYYLSGDDINRTYLEGATHPRLNGGKGKLQKFSPKLQVQARLSQTSNGKKYVHIDLSNSSVSPGNLLYGNAPSVFSGKEAYTTGFYTEQADIKIHPESSGTLIWKHFPTSTQATGQVSTSAGFNADASGVGFNISKTVSVDLKDFTIEKKTDRNETFSRYKLSLMAEGGEYISRQSMSDCITKLCNLPTLAYTDMPIYDQVIYQLPETAQGVQYFDIYLEYTLQYVVLPIRIPVFNTVANSDDIKEGLYTVKLSYHLPISVNLNDLKKN